MKLNKYQKARLLEFEWDIVVNDVDGKEQNCGWISINPEHGTIFQEVCDVFRLTGEGQDVKLLVVATREEFENEDD